MSFLNASMNRFAPAALTSALALLLLPAGCGGHAFAVGPPANDSGQSGADGGGTGSDGGDPGTDAALPDAASPDGCQGPSCSAACPPLACTLQCSNGMRRDQSGCATCMCAPGDAGTPPPFDGGTATAQCGADEDCPMNQVCGYKASLACAATGSCFPRQDVECLVYAPGCACDGTMISVACNGLPSGYDTKPLLHTGECTDGGSSDAGK